MGKAREQVTYFPDRRKVISFSFRAHKNSRTSQNFIAKEMGVKLGAIDLILSWMTSAFLEREEIGGLNTYHCFSCFAEHSYLRGISLWLWGTLHFPTYDHSIDKRFLIEYGIIYTGRQAIWVDLHGHANDFAVLSIYHPNGALIAAANVLHNRYVLQL